MTISNFKSLLCLTILFSSTILFAQAEENTISSKESGILIVQHNFKNRARSFEQEDRIDLLLNNGRRYKGRIANISAETITINSKLALEKIAVSDISAIIYNNTVINKFLAGTFATSSLASLVGGVGAIAYGLTMYSEAEQSSAGIGIFEATAANQAEQESATMIAASGGAAILGSAILFGAYHIVKRKKYDLRKNWNIRIVE